MAARRKTGNVTLKDIAQATGFSANTVSRALADSRIFRRKQKRLSGKKHPRWAILPMLLPAFSGQE